MHISLSSLRIRWKHAPIASLKDRCGRCLLSWFLLYLIVGNLPRFWQVAGFSDNFLVTEFILFSGVLLYILSFCRQLHGYMAWYGVIAIIVASFGVGVYLFGFDPKPFLYAARLAFMVVSGVALGTILHEYRNRTSFLHALTLLLRGYLAVAALSLAILLLFPDSALLWTWLKEYGITYGGDPHVNRLISPYLDPNFYGAIAVIPLLLAGYAYCATRQIRYLIYALCLTFSLLLTSSRSGVATLLLVVVGIGARLLMWRLAVVLTRQRLLLLAALTMALLIFILTQIEAISYLVWRCFILSTDDSALARLISFQFGWGLFVEHPLLGTGYNYLSLLMKDLSDLSSVDSSLLALLINFGVIGTSAFALLFFLWSHRLYAAWKLVSFDDRVYRSFVASYYIYLVVCISFTCNFNNLLFYQFWLIPALTLGVFLTLETDKRGEYHPPKKSLEAQR